MNYYFDSVRGNNIFDGLTPDTAKRDLEGLRELLLANKGIPGTNFLFEAESTFTPSRYVRIGVGSEPATYINGTAINPIKFSSYSYDGTSTRKPHFQLIKTAVSSDWIWDDELKLWYWNSVEGYGSTTTTWGSYPLVLIDGEKLQGDTCSFSYFSKRYYSKWTIRSCFLVDDRRDSREVVCVDS